MGKEIHEEEKQSSASAPLHLFGLIMKKRKLIFAFLGMLLSAAELVMSCVSLAWFAQNGNTTADKMNISIAVSSDLVISGDMHALSSSGINDLNGGNPYAVTQTSTVTKFYPATHDGDYGTYENGLKTTNDEDTFAIDYNTGVGEGVRYVAAVNPAVLTEKHYYVDYTVYIAAHPSQLDHVAVKLKIASSSDSDCHKAASVDVYRDSASAGNYIGTLNVAGIDSTENQFPITGDYAGTACTELYVLGSAEEGASVPFREEGYLTYLLRFYFDGALLKSATQTFVRTAELDYADMSLCVSFTAEEIG